MTCFEFHFTLKLIFGPRWYEGNVTNVLPKVRCMSKYPKLKLVTTQLQ
jgi:hypothetical protein